MKKKALILLMLLAATIVTTVAATAQQPKDLLPELKKGGYVLFIRHPRTNPDQADTDPLNLDNIKAQRQLSDDGRKQARALGESFRALGIPVEKVISSKFQRAQEAARLLAVGEVTTSIDVSEGDSSFRRTKISVERRRSGNCCPPSPPRARIWWWSRTSPTCKTPRAKSSAISTKAKWSCSGRSAMESSWP